MGFGDWVQTAWKVITLEAVVEPLAKASLDTAIKERDDQQNNMDEWNKMNDEREQQIADDEKAFQQRLIDLTAGNVQLDPALANEQESDAWVAGIASNLGSLDTMNTLTLEQRNTARVLDNRFNYAWDIPDETDFTIYNKINAAQDESSHVTHVEDSVHPSDREDDSAYPADADDNRTGLTKDDALKLYAASLEKPEDFYGAGGADPGEEEPDSWWEGWFDNLFSEPTNDPNDAMYNGDPDRSTGEKAAIIAIGVVGGAGSGALLGMAVPPSQQTAVITLMTAVGAVGGVLYANN